MQISFFQKVKTFVRGNNITMVFIAVGIWANAAFLLKIDNSLSYVGGSEITVGDNSQELREINQTLSSLKNQVECYRRGNTGNLC